MPVPETTRNVKSLETIHCLLSQASFVTEEKLMLREVIMETTGHRLSSQSAREHHTVCNTNQQIHQSQRRPNFTSLPALKPPSPPPPDPSLILLIADHAKAPQLHLTCVNHSSRFIPRSSNERQTPLRTARACTASSADVLQCTSTLSESSHISAWLMLTSSVTTASFSAPLH
jgi:hypothetical protein